MLFSKEFEAFRRDHGVALIRTEDDATIDLRDRYGVWRTSAWCIVLDERAEILDSFACDAAAAGCTPGETERFAPSLAAALRKSLALEESLEFLRRRAVANPTDEEAFERFVGTLVRFQSRTRLLAFAERALADERVPAHLRRRSEIHRATSRMRIHLTTEKRIEDPASLVAEAVAALALEPNYVHAERLRVTIWGELGLEFDLPGRRAQLVEIFANVRASMESGEARLAFDAHERALLDSVDRQIEVSRSIMERYRAGDLTNVQPMELISAPIHLGESQIVIDMIDDGVLGDSRAARWRREALEKLAREAKR